MSQTSEQPVAPAAVVQGAARSSWPRAKASEPHWIVKRMSKFGIGELSSRLHFLHPSFELAQNEAQRLAAKHPGRRFSVYAAGPSFKVEKTIVTDETT